VPKTATQLFDVWAVSLATKTVRRMAESATEENAEAVVMMAVARRGVETEFFAAAPAGMYTDGDTWKGKTRDA
jgi:hypothetical protein